MPRSLVVDPAFAWSDRPGPQHRYADTVIYEMHVKGFTMAIRGSQPSCGAPTPDSATRPRSTTWSASG